MTRKWMCAVALLGSVLVVAPSAAFAGFGVRIGTGTSFANDEAGGDDLESLPFALGVGYKMDLTVLELEIDALWWRDSAEFGPVEATTDYIATPVIASFSFPVIPAFLGLSIGAGLDPHFPVASDPENDNLETMVLYLPVQLGASFDLQLLSIGVDIRYEHQLTATTDNNDEGRVHHLMFFGGAFF